MIENKLWCAMLVATTPVTCFSVASAAGGSFGTEGYLGVTSTLRGE